MVRLKEVEGDLIKFAEEGKFDVIIHGCNCQCTMGAGIARTIKNRYPEAYKADCETVKGDREKMGDFSSVEVGPEDSKFVIVNAYTQFYWGSGSADYEAIRAAMAKIKEVYSGLRIGYPLLGAGLAGGDWGVISGIIDEELDGEEHTLVRFKP